MPQTLAEKLHVLPGEELLVLHAPKHIEDLLLPMPEGASIVTEIGKEYPVVLAFCEQLTDLVEDWHRLRTAVQPHGAIWVAYPKKSGSIKSDLSRDTLGAKVELLSPDWLPVTLISIDETWSAMRFRQVEDIPKITRKSIR